MQDRVVISSWCWGSDYYNGHFSLFDAPARAAELNFTAVELNDFMLPPPRFSRLVRPFIETFTAFPPADLWRYRSESFLKIKAELDPHDLRCACWTMNTDLTGSTRAWTSQQMYANWAWQGIETLNASKVRVILGEGEADTGTIIDRLIELAQFFLSRSAELEFVVENHWGISTDIGRFVEIVQNAHDRLDTRTGARFGICLDPLNTPHAPDRDAWARMAPLTKHVHIKRLFKDGKELAVDYTPLFTLLHAENYRGDFTIEVEGVAASGDLNHILLETQALIEQNLP